MVRFEICILLFLFSILSACTTSTIPQTTHFNSNSPDAIVMFLLPKQNNSVTNLRKINTKTKEFDKKILVTKSGFFGSGGYALDPDEESFYLTLERADPGEYTLTQIYTSGYPIETWKCFPKASPFFTFSSGKIYIVRADVLWGVRLPVSDEYVLSAFEKNRSNYPSLEGEATIARPQGLIGWSNYPVSPLNWTRCALPKNFDFLETP